MGHIVTTPHIGTPSRPITTGPANVPPYPLGAPCLDPILPHGPMMLHLDASSLYYNDYHNASPNKLLMGEYDESLRLLDRERDGLPLFWRHSRPTMSFC